MGEGITIREGRAARSGALHIALADAHSVSAIGSTLSRSSNRAQKRIKNAASITDNLHGLFKLESTSKDSTAMIPVANIASASGSSRAANVVPNITSTGPDEPEAMMRRPPTTVCPRAHRPKNFVASSMNHATYARGWVLPALSRS